MFARTAVDDFELGHRRADRVERLDRRRANGQLSKIVETVGHGREMLGDLGSPVETVLAFSYVRLPGRTQIGQR